MRKKTKKIINDILHILLLFFVAVFGFTVFVIIITELFFTGPNIHQDFCQNIYPSGDPLNKYMEWKSYAKTVGVEPGYVECCRFYYNNHKKDTECKIFKYGDEE